MKLRFVVILICLAFVQNCIASSYEQKTNPVQNNSNKPQKAEIFSWKNSPKVIGQIKLDIESDKRDERLGFEKGKRVFSVVIYYPAYSAVHCENAKYDSVYRPKKEKMFRTDNAIHRYSQFTLSYLNRPTNTYINAKPFPNQKFPVIIFSPGSGINQRLYQNFYRTLVNAGYIVVGINHSYDANYCVLTNGEILKSTLAERMKNSSFAKVEALFTKERIEDINETVRQIKIWNKRNKLLAGIFDVSKVGVAGHSVGGKAAFVVNKINSDVKAAVIFDGIFNNAIIDNKNLTENSKEIKSAYIQDKPFLLFLSNDMYKDGEINGAWKFNKDIYITLLTKSKPPFYCIYISKIGHMAYTDLGFILSKAEYKRFFRKDLPQDFYSSIYTSSVDFFDTYLAGEKNKLKEFKSSLNNPLFMDMSFNE